MPVLLVPYVLVLLLLLVARQTALHVRQRHIDLGVLQLVMLVQTPFRTVRLTAGLHAALVVSLDLVRVPPHSLALLVLAIALADELVVLSRMGLTSYFRRRVISWFFSSMSSFIWVVRAMLARRSRQYS